MNCNNFGGIDEILKYLGYEKIPDDEKEENGDDKSNNNKSNCNCKNSIPQYTATINPSGESDGNACAFVNLDIPCGFQDISPLALVVIGEIIGDILSGQLPFNVANAVSNWFNLIGQIIETYAAQQSYFQSGPGRYYNPIYKNVSNPFCTSSEVTEDSDGSSKSSESNGSNGKQENDSNNSEDDNNSQSNINKLREDIEELKKKYEVLQKKMGEIQQQIDNSESSK